MDFFKSTFGLIVLTLNLLVGVGLLAGAYAQYLSPVSFPLLSIAGLGFPFFVILNLLLALFWLLVCPRYVWLPIVLFWVVGDALLTYCPFSFGSSSKGDQVLKVLTYNTMGLESKVNDKGKHVYPVWEYVKKSGANIVGLQEFPYQNKELINDIKKVYPYFKMVSIGDGFNLYVACLSKTPILSGERIKVISPGNGAGLFQVKVGDKQIPFIVTHLESNKLSGDDKEIYESILADSQNRFLKSGSKHLLFKLADAASLRGPQADAIATKIQELNDPYTIVCGDFNDIPLSYTHRVIGKGLQDTYREAGFGPGVTFHEHLMFFRIDHMMVGPKYRVLKSKIDTSIKASDHYPYWCELEL